MLVGYKNSACLYQFVSIVSNVCINLRFKYLFVSPSPKIFPLTIYYLF